MSDAGGELGRVSELIDAGAADPLRTVPSMVSLIAMFRRMRHDDVDVDTLA
jgi:hypothetical protein